ncbi:glycine cleavage system protein GcvH [Demequina muriae]|uniref:Glycine cleavage system H protein n=1 Tax=Demequina muriae TaxID=3051664 RepID=A0ABT8GGM2_9MICO|nr:glycine cleavage system protein GcvH [Demequina sp. EGI L300058]MDN4480584.1 glycine cleavage system protein GcvH [Demequina sp. EGI L300058]
MPEIPEDLQYSAEHEWVRGELVEGSVVTVGITAYAADALGDVVYVEAPEVGAAVVAGQVCGELESTKAVSELYSPVTGTVAEVNPALESAPDLINSDVYGEGWIFTVTLAEEPASLLDPAAYAGTTA